MGYSPHVLLTIAERKGQVRRTVIRAVSEGEEERSSLALKSRIPEARDTTLHKYGRPSLRHEARTSGELLSLEVRLPGICPKGLFRASQRSLTGPP